MQQCPTPGSFWRGLDANGLSIYNADFVINRNFLRATIYGEPMSARTLTSYWSGNAVQVYYPPRATPATRTAELSRNNEPDGRRKFLRRPFFFGNKGNLISS